jgi:hypothetical protein
MAAAHYDSSPDGGLYLAPPDAGMYDGTSSESSASSPLNYNVRRTLFPGLASANALEGLRQLIWCQWLHALPIIPNAVFHKRGEYSANGSYPR